MDSPAATTAHQAEASRRARRYTGTAVSAKHNAFANLNQSYAASTLPARRMITASMAGKRGPKPKGSTAEREAVARGQRGRAHRVELFVRVDARPVDTRRQQRVDEERADDDRAEHDHRPAALGRRVQDVRLRASRVEGRCRLELRDHARAMVDGGSAIGPARTVSENAPDHPGRGTVTEPHSTADRQRPRAPLDALPSRRRYPRDPCR